MNLLLLLALGDRGFLVLLVLRHQVVHVALCLCEFHLVHTFTSIPMQESLAPEHSSELITNTLEELLNGGRVTNEGRGHLETTWGNRAEGGLNVVGNPLHEVCSVFVLDIAHLVFNFLHGDLTTAAVALVRVELVPLERGECLQDSRAGEISTIPKVRCSHHVLRVEHLLGQFRHADSAERLSTTAGEGGKADHEEVKTWEWHHVNGQFTKVRVKLTRETQTGGDARHDRGDQVVQVAVRRVRQLQGTSADIVQSLIKVSTIQYLDCWWAYLIVDTEGLIRVLNKLVHGEGGIVWFNNGIGDLGGWDHGESGHHTVWELLADLGD